MLLCQQMRHLLSNSDWRGAARQFFVWQGRPQTSEKRADGKGVVPKGLYCGDAAIRPSRRQPSCQWNFRTSEHAIRMTAVEQNVMVNHGMSLCADPVHAPCHKQPQSVANLTLTLAMWRVYSLMAEKPKSLELTKAKRQ